MDQDIKCIERDCPNTFTITEGEERFYTDKGLFLPKRCPDCRKKRKDQKESEGEGEGEGESEN